MTNKQYDIDVILETLYAQGVDDGANKSIPTPKADISEAKQAITLEINKARKAELEPILAKTTLYGDDYGELDFAEEVEDLVVKRLATLRKELES